MKFDIGDKVKLRAPLPYLKTADNMPMLRPPDLVAIDEVGIVTGINSELIVKFRRGSFLISGEKLVKC